MVNFALMHAAPGGSFDTESLMSAENRQALIQHYRLDRPVWEQYINYAEKRLRCTCLRRIGLRSEPGWSP